MAIRLRRVPGVGLIAICAARSMPKDGDVYLDDEQHHALSIKFDLDIASMHGHKAVYRGSPEEAAMNVEEANNPNRDDWDRTFGGQRQQRQKDNNDKRPRDCYFFTHS